MKPLPYGPVEALHILPPGSLLAILLTAIAALLALMIWMWWLKRRRRSIQDQVTRKTQPGSKKHGFAAVVHSIRDHHLESRDYREGCHELSAATKSHLERTAGFEAEEMTVEEIATHLNSPQLEAFLACLRGHQFGKVPPNRNQFKALCRDAPRAAKVDGPRGRRP